MANKPYTSDKPTEPGEYYYRDDVAGTGRLVAHVFARPEVAGGFLVDLWDSVHCREYYGTLTMEQISPHGGWRKIGEVPRVRKEYGKSSRNS